MPQHKAGFYEKFIKRLLDILISGVALILLSPIMLIVAILVAVKLGRPVIFHQQRPGKNEKIFGLCKFRSMTNEKDAEGKLLPDADRLTSFGKILRKTSLDELPELWNIFIGQMSLIGPRPLLVSYLPYYTDEEKLRHSVRPGLTGLAQISGRNLLDWDKRLAKDVEYVNNISFKLDVYIFFMTFVKVFKTEDIVVDTNIVEGNLAKIRQAKKDAESDVK